MLRRLVALGLLALAPAGCGSREGGGSGGPGAPSAGPGGTRVLRYAIPSREVGRRLPQVAARPARAGARPGLLVFLHGRGGTAAGQAEPAFVRALARRGIAAVFPDGGGGSYWHDRASGRWGAYVMREVIPEAVRRLGTDPRRVAIGGISMGGFGALDLARRHPGRFCAVGGHSAALWTNAALTATGAFDDAADFARHDVIAAARAGAFRGTPVFLDTGTRDPFRPADQELAATLGVPLRTPPGGHAPAYWRAHYADYAAWYARRLADC